MAKKQKLELTWIGKDRRPKLEPRILIEDPDKSHHAPQRVSDNDIFDNMLIHGDNLLALKALEQEYSGGVKCVYIDPPFNTGEMFENYDDGVEHSIWLSQMRERLVHIHRLLHETGTLVVHIDDNEMAYLTVIMDEIFGRSNRAYIVTFKQGAATGHKAINPGCVSTTNFLLIYAKDKKKWNPNRVFTARDRDKRYSQFIKNMDGDYSNWKFQPLTSAFAEANDIPLKEARKLIKDEPHQIDDFVLKNAEQVVRLARPDYNSVSEDARTTIDRSLDNPNEVFLLEREKYSDMYFTKGERILFYKDKLKYIDGNWVAGEPLTTLWDDLLSNNLHKEGSVKFPKGKKPEALIQRVLDLTTNKNDIVLDSFLGSGTTAAVAHKMHRRWIGIELGDHCDTHCAPRLAGTINGSDESGVTKSLNWKGGGGFRYYELGPSLIEKDKWGNPIISKEFDPLQLTQAMCKLEGFDYAPDPNTYWMQGRSSESDFIYVTSQTMAKAALTKLSDEVGEGRSLLVCCPSFRAKEGDFINLTLKKIPKAVLKKCEWGRDDYSLQIKELPTAPQPEFAEEEAKAKKPRRKFGKDNPNQKELF